MAARSGRLGEGQATLQVAQAATKRVDQEVQLAAPDVIFEALARVTRKALGVSLSEVVAI